MQDAQESALVTLLTKRFRIENLHRTTNDGAFIRIVSPNDCATIAEGRTLHDTVILALMYMVETLEVEVDRNAGKEAALAKAASDLRQAERRVVELDDEVARLRMAQIASAQRAYVDKGKEAPVEGEPLELSDETVDKLSTLVDAMVDAGIGDEDGDRLAADEAKPAIYKTGVHVKTQDGDRELSTDGTLHYIKE